jgi:hypothetical protein
VCWRVAYRAVLCCVHNPVVWIHSPSKSELPAVLSTSTNCTVQSVHIVLRLRSGSNRRFRSPRREKPCRVLLDVSRNTSVCTFFSCLTWLLDNWRINYKVSKDVMPPFSGPSSTRLRIMVPPPPGSETLRTLSLACWTLKKEAIRRTEKPGNQTKIHNISEGLIFQQYICENLVFRTVYIQQMKKTVTKLEICIS